jgi:hypothetical protein
LEGVHGTETFAVRVFKFFYPRSQKSKISLVAHKREVSDQALHKYVPEFVEDFYEKDTAGKVNYERNYIVKAYVFGEYLDRNVSLERSEFKFQLENDVLQGISQTDIEERVASIAKDAIGIEISVRQERKREKVETYVEEHAPWHRTLLRTIDLTGMPFNPSDEEIETRFQREKFGLELQIKRDVSTLMAEGSLDQLQENVAKTVGKISGTSKNDLVHYIALRRNILDLFGKSLELDDNGAYSSEGVVHDIIFPRKGDSETTGFDDHNLWIVDERLNFTSYVSSDLPLNGGSTGRADLIAYNKRILFRGDNEPSNPVTIFEFKKPQRDDFVNPSSSEDPVQQIVRYVNSIRDGRFKTPEGKKIRVEDHTPFYGYVVCELTSKVENWLLREKNFKVMPDRLGWFQWMENINLYIEVLSWDKILNDARMRNRVFFQKLGI